MRGKKEEKEDSGKDEKSLKDSENLFLSPTVEKINKKCQIRRI